MNDENKTSEIFRMLGFSPFSPKKLKPTGFTCNCGVRINLKDFKTSHESNGKYFQCGCGQKYFSPSPEDLILRGRYER